MQNFNEKYNWTPFVAETLFTQDQDGLDCATAVVKASFKFSSKGELHAIEREFAAPILSQDIYYDQADNSSIRYPSDRVYAKQGTDIIVNGHAYGHGRKQFTASVQCANVNKQIRVSGHRVWSKQLMGYAPSSPQAVEKIPVNYEHAYGGRPVVEGDELSFYEANPVGRGFEKVYRQQALPNLEYPKALLRGSKDRPPPCALGVVSSNWSQRRVYAGSFDEHWKQSRAPLLPEDFQLRFFNVVAQDQIVSAGLRGGEQIILTHLHPHQAILKLTLPVLSIQASFYVKQHIINQKLELDTVLLEPDAQLLQLTYRKSLLLDEDLLYLKSVHYKMTAA